MDGRQLRSTQDRHGSWRELWSTIVKRLALGAPEGSKQASGVGSAMTRGQQLFEFARDEMEAQIATGRAYKLEYFVSLIQLAYMYLDPLPIPERPPLWREMAQALERAFAAGGNDVEAPVESVPPLTFICSYPRSGNTVLVQSAAIALKAQVFENMPGSMFPFSKRVYPRAYPYVRLVKDHVARPMYLNDRVGFIVRDGRDTMVSLAHMTLKQGFHKFSQRGELADFIRWLDQSYPFGGWARHMREVAHLMQVPAGKHVLRYEDFMAESARFMDFVRFLDPGCRADDAALQEIYDGRSKIFERIKGNPHSREAWGMEGKFDPNSLFHEWSQSRQGSNWMKTWDGAARKAFHETGATDFLIEYGYETDSGWWK